MAKINITGLDVESLLDLREKIWTYPASVDS